MLNKRCRNENAHTSSRYRYKMQRYKTQSRDAFSRIVRRDILYPMTREFVRIKLMQ